MLQANGINCTKFGHQQVAQIIAESEKFLRMKILPDERKGSLVDWLSVHSKKKVECGVILYADFNIGVSSAEICTISYCVALIVISGCNNCVFNCIFTAVTDSYQPIES